jgi:hypothetical protein
MNNEMINSNGGFEARTVNFTCKPNKVPMHHFRLSLIDWIPLLVTELEFVNVQKKSKLQYHCPTISQIETHQELANMSLIPPDI